MAKIYGELKRAQLEQQSSDPTGIVSRMYSNVAVPTAARAKYHNGSSWKTLAFTDEIPAASGNYITIAVTADTYTVDWSSGLHQRISFTQSCLVSFSNWQSGYDHKLSIENASSGQNSGLNVVFDLDEQFCTDNFHPLPLIGNDVQTFIWQYNASVTKNWQSIRMTNSGHIPAGIPLNIEFCPQSKAMIYGLNTNPFWETRSFAKQSNKHFLYDMISGVRRQANVAIASLATDIAIACDGSYAVIVGTASSYQSAIGLSEGYGPVGGVQPAVIPTGAAYAAACNPRLPFAYVVGHATTPFISAYFKTQASPIVAASPQFIKVSNPGTLPSGTIVGLAFHPLKNLLYALDQTNGVINCYVFNSGGFGTNTQVATGLTITAAGTGNGKRIAVHPKGTYIAVISSTNLVVYPLDASGIPVIASAITPAVGPIGSPRGIKWDLTGRFLYLSTAATTDGAMMYYDFGLATNLNNGPYFIGPMANATAASGGIGVHPSNLFTAWSVDLSVGPFYCSMYNSSFTTTIPEFKYFRTFYSHG